MNMNKTKRAVSFLLQKLNSGLENTAGVRVVRCAGTEAYERKRERGNKTWDYERFGGYWVGGRLPIPNLSQGYHGILKQWWEHYNQGNECLLISESDKAKHCFQDLYPHWNFTTLDLYDIQAEEVDVVADLCGDLSGELLRKSFDLIICQATLEHVYDPFKAVRNMVSLLRPNGIIAVHTHTPPFPYHGYPRDYFRFSLDWFEDLESHLKGIELLELIGTRGHVFAALRRNLAGSLQVTTP
jgi:hypothetical protein